jgi:ketosteroid isomerase-like protein
MSDTGAQQIVERYWRAASSGEYDALLDLFADDVVVEWPQSGERFEGKQQCVRIWQSYPGGRPEFQGVDRVLTDGRLVVAEGRILYPDGKTYLVVGIFEVADGRISHEIDYFSEPFPVPDWRAAWS